MTPRFWMAVLAVLSLAGAFVLGMFLRDDPRAPGSGYRQQVEASQQAAALLESGSRRGLTHARIASRLRPSVVSLFGNGVGGTSSGTGVVFHPDGHVLTNLHVVEGVTTLVVTLSSQERYYAHVVGEDPPTDLAVVRVDAPPGTLEPARFGDSDALMVGEEVLALGNAYGFGWTVSQGIISSLHRSRLRIDGDEEDSRYRDFIQTDATISPGNSGGPLVDMRGRVVGINGLVGAGGGDGFGFAIPARDALFVAEQLRVRGHVVRSGLGISVEDVSVMGRSVRRELGIPFTGGVRVSTVRPGSAAEQAGLQVGDVIVALNGRPVPDTEYLRNRIAHTPVSSRVELRIYREGGTLTLAADLGSSSSS